MVNCCKCNKTLCKSTKGNLCRNCYCNRNKGNENVVNDGNNISNLNNSKVINNQEKSKNDPVLNDDVITDKNLIEFIKDGMLKDF